VLKLPWPKSSAASPWPPWCSTTATRARSRGDAAVVFFACIGFDAIATADEETRNPQRNLPIGILGGLGVCTLIDVVVGAVITGMVPYQELAVADPLSRALDLAAHHGARPPAAVHGVIYAACGVRHSRLRS